MGEKCPTANDPIQSDSRGYTLFWIDLTGTCQKGELEGH